MANVKAALKAVKSALDARDFTGTASKAQAVLELDPTNYFARIFLGKALEEQGKTDEAESLYEQATKLKPDEPLGWQGLCHVLESQGSCNVSKHSASALKLAKLYVQREDQHQCQTVVDKLVAFAKENGSRSQYTHALEVYLPSSPVYDFLEGRIQSPAVTYLRLAEINEADEAERINKVVGERRTRLGAKVSQVVNEVRREVFGSSNLETLYQHVIDWTSDDEERRLYEEKLLQHAYDHLLSLPAGEKSVKRDQVFALAHGMVLIKHTWNLPWHIELEWRDVSDVAQLGHDTLLQYARLFPVTGLAHVIQGFLGVRAQQDEDDSADAKSMAAGDSLALRKDDRLSLLDDGIVEAQDSPLAHRLVAAYYVEIGEYEGCIDFARSGLKLIQQEAQKCGLRLQENQDAVLTDLATSLIYYQAPKNHPEAKHLFDDVLKRNPTSTAALLGIGLIHEEQENYSDASSFLERALTRDPENIRIAAEAAWCQALDGNAEAGLGKLQQSLENINALKKTPYDLKAQVCYRVGRCLWDINTDRAARKDRSGPYAFFLAAIKANPSLAPAYTILGQYYTTYAKDKRRARQCFQKAFELSAGEVVAAEQLARAYANDADWDIVEVIAQRLIDSGIVRSAPGSKRKAISWPFAALAVVQINKQEYSQAVHSYQAALRITSSDYHCWVGLGESYLNAGRYNAAGKALEHAESLVTDCSHENDVWFARYMLSNVHRELGDFEDAIAGYRSVLKLRPSESGVAMALLQSLVEDAHHQAETGAFGRAVDLAKETLTTALDVSKHHSPSVNFWRAVGDSCMIIAGIQSLAMVLPVNIVKQLLALTSNSDGDSLLESSDGVTEASLTDTETATKFEALASCVTAGLLAQKEAVRISSHDNLARSIAWYNLGWTEHQAHQMTSRLENAKIRAIFARCAKAAVKCFKHAIELEASNADFWNALGVATTSLNPTVAQHSLVRSLHLNERSARTWTNLGSLYMVQQDFELAHEAFGRAQSTDPAYVFAWLGEGLIALHFGDVKEARSHFRHAIEIGDATDVLVKQQYSSVAFDKLLSDEAGLFGGLEDLVAPIFALQQIGRQSIDALSYQHLATLYGERAGDFESSTAGLQGLAAGVESVYETSEAASALGQFVRLKSDLARGLLSTGKYSDAIENAETALDLSEDIEPDSLSTESKVKLRLSAHLTSGLAHYYQGSLDESTKMFEAALEESNSSSDIHCLLAQVLWAKGSAKERNVAKETLIGTIERQPTHANAMMLLGAMSALDGDQETHDGVIGDLQSSLRISRIISLEEREKIEILLTTSASLSTSTNGSEKLNEIDRSIMLAPEQSLGWSKLAEHSDDANAANMALSATARAVPPNGHVVAETLSKAFADVGTPSAAQKATAISPWLVDGWRSLNTHIG